MAGAEVWSMLEHLKRLRSNRPWKRLRIPDADNEPSMLDVDTSKIARDLRNTNSGHLYSLLRPWWLLAPEI